MPPTEHHAGGASRGHEPSGVSLRGVIAFVVIFVITSAVLSVLLWVVYRAMMEREVKTEAPISALVADRIPPPLPRLQPSPYDPYHRLPKQDMDELRATEHQEFARRGWVDAATGDVRVPDTILDRITPTRTPTTAASATTTQLSR
jgi:hypothetical protein